ncbi:MAG: DUF3810 domain-containing protein [Clostridia bacterium]|nr:DUF3810 domain-containing protein [Clostridia bacterium]
MKLERVKRILPKLLLYLLPALLAAAMYFLLPLMPWVAEYIFARGIFRVISVPLGFIVSILPFSVTETVVFLSVPLAVTLIVLLVRRCRKKGVNPLPALLKRVWLILSCGLLMYMVMHGANYYRYRAADLLELDTSKQSAEYLQAVCIDLADKASAEREALTEDEDGVAALSESVYKTLYAANSCYAKLDDEYPLLWGTVWFPKPVLHSHLWSYTGIEGVYCPIFCESNVNIDIPDFDIPYTAAHELAHTRGFAYEDECNFFAFLACSVSDSADYRYSGYFSAYIYCANALYKYDKDMWKAAYAHCSDGMKRDIRARNAYWKQFEGKVMEASHKANDTFIKAQRDDRGSLSYGEAVKLILAYYEKCGFTA